MNGRTCEMIEARHPDDPDPTDRVCGKPATHTVELTTLACDECAEACRQEQLVVSKLEEP